MDETGCDDFVDKRVHKVVVPEGYVRRTIPVPADRTFKRATLVGAIPASGEALKPIIIVPRETIEKELRLWGYTNPGFTFLYQENGFITKSTFDLWVRTVLIVCFAGKRHVMNYHGPALLLLDGCTAHTLERVDAELRANGINVKPIPPHSSDQVQALDLGIFGTFKRYYTRPLSVHVTSRQTGQAIRMCNAWIEATVPHVIVGAFRRSGLVPIQGENGLFYLQIERNQARQLRHWRNAPFTEDGMGDDGRRRERLV
jgi:hypothetical protein